MQNQHIPTKKIKTNVIASDLYSIVHVHEPMHLLSLLKRRITHTQPIDSNAKPTHPDKEDKDKCDCQ
ncbi:hypothetical protein H5410_000501 [Solanum commersonii]|uniref:Uncharacterized protein n=1 Tax=Solanum commersonii TaxID=4109 RepID=A0A9J6AWC4_SOLCO|nr:hypothetical protein H5410_000501 [Solanum commersonii]